MPELERLIRGGLRRLRHVPGHCLSVAGDAAVFAENILVPKTHSLVILDDFFPSLGTAFRIAEFNTILDEIDGAVVYSACDRRQEFQEYCARYPQLSNRVRRYHPRRRLKATAGYVVFLNNAFNYLEALEAAQLPFVVELYPGGGFYLDDSVSDAKLARVLRSPLFHKVIVTQNVTRDYLLRKRFCREDQIEFVFGVVVLSDELGSAAPPRTRFGIDKSTLDVCFVANKYMQRGEDKGYDRFIACARILAGHNLASRFHVVGNFTRDDLEVGDLGDRITFYGHRHTSFFPGFYAQMDLIVSPNTPFTFTPGAFDGFPTGCCIEAALCGTAMFVTDELGMNDGYFRNGEEIVIIPREASKIAELVEGYSENPGSLVVIGERGRAAVSRMFARDAQMTPRLRVLSGLLGDAGGV